MVWRSEILTLYPDAFLGPLAFGVIGRAHDQGLWSLGVHDLRAHAPCGGGSVDDRPAGGGPGMVMRADVMAASLDRIPRDGRPAILLTPRGHRITQARIRSLASGPGVILLAPRFEGYDERIVEARDLEPLSLADIILAGGELAAMALLEACVRLLPGALGDARSSEEESFEGPLLEYAHYTHPNVFEGREVPKVLRGGHHGAIAAHRQRDREESTRRWRPDLWQDYASEKDR